MSEQLPWESGKMVDAAIDTVCRVRDEHPDDLRATLDRIPRAAMTELVMVLAAMVDADAPLDVVRRWTHEGFVGYREREAVKCPRGHVVLGDNAVANGFTPGGRQRWRCRKCANARHRSAA